MIQYSCVRVAGDVPSSPHSTGVASSVHDAASRGGLQLADHRLAVQVTLVVLLECLQGIVLVLEDDLCYPWCRHGDRF